MKSLNQYITEFVNINNIKKKEYKYFPKSKNELIENIKTELKNGNTDLNCIDTSKITDMNCLFDKTDDISLNDKQQKTLDISEWDVSNVQKMQYMFFNCEHFNCNLSNWDVSNVRNMNSMFYNCSSFDCDLSNWNVSNVESTENMFYNCQQFNCDLSNWDVTNIENMQYMFVGCERFKSDLSNWDVSKVSYKAFMFYKSGLKDHEPSWYK